MTAALRLPFFAMYLAATALVAPTLMCCITPSGQISSGWPSWVLNNSTSPT